MVTVIMESTFNTVLNWYLNVILWEDLLSDLNRRKTFTFESYSFYILKHWFYFIQVTFKNKTVELFAFSFHALLVSIAVLWNQLLFTCVTAAGNFTVWPSVFPVIPAESRIPSLCTGSARPYLVVNRILICSGRLGLPHQQGSCSSILSTLLSGATVFATSTKR